MFISYSETFGYEDHKTGVQYYDCTIEDTDFTETVFNTRLTAEEIFYRIYSVKNVDIISEFLRFMMYDIKATNLSVSKVLSFYEGSLFIQHPEFGIKVKDRIKKLQMVW